jgi:hypothetical protein
MDFRGSGIFEKVHNMRAGGTAHYGIIHQNNTLAADCGTDGVELYVYGSDSCLLRILNECSSDITVLN